MLESDLNLSFSCLSPVNKPLRADFPSAFPTHSDCRRLDLPGYRHHTSVTRDVVSASSLDECSFECGHAEAYCRTFSYNEATAIDNCVLSALKAADIIMNQERRFPLLLCAFVYDVLSVGEPINRCSLSAGLQEPHVGWETVIFRFC